MQPARAQNWERVNRSLYHVAKGDNTEDLDDLCEEFDPDERHSVREVMSIARDFLEKEDAEMCSGDNSSEYWPAPAETNAVHAECAPDDADRSRY